MAQAAVSKPAPRKFKLTPTDQPTPDTEIEHLLEMDQVEYEMVLQCSGNGRSQCAGICRWVTFRKRRFTASGGTASGYHC